MKKVDIRKIYVCKIQAVTDVCKEKSDEHKSVRLKGSPFVIGKKIQSYVLDENDVSYGLFVKGVYGYRHILTDAKYKESTNPSVCIGRACNKFKIYRIINKKRKSIGIPLD